MGCKVCGRPVVSEMLCEIHLKHRQWKSDFALFCKDVFPHWFSYDFAPFHYKIFNLLQETTANKYENMKLIVVFREAGKTTIMMAYVIHRILFRLKKFILWIASSYEQANARLTDIKREFELNPMIRKYFGDLTIDISEAKAGLGKWSEREIITNGVRFRIRGMRQRLRGSRPDLIICDDIEDEENTLTPEQRERNKKWFNRVLIPALAIDNGEIIYVGTPVAYDTILTMLMNSETWKKIVVPITTEFPPTKESCTWLEKFPPERIMQIYEDMKSKGDEVGFYQEYLLQFVDESKLKFKDYIRKTEINFVRENDINWVDFMGDKKNVDIYIGIDLATPNGKDYTAIAIVGIDALDNRYILKVLRGHFPLRDELKDGFAGDLVEIDRSKIYRLGVLDEIVRLIKEYQPMAVGFEAVGFQASALYELQRLMTANGVWARLEGLKHRIKKEVRIEQTLLPYYATGKVWHNVGLIEYETELRYFPEFNHDDTIDAVANAFLIMKPAEPIEERAKPSIFKQVRYETNWMVL